MEVRVFAPTTCLVTVLEAAMSLPELQLLLASLSKATTVLVGLLALLGMEGWWEG